MTINNGQSQYVMRELFNTGIHPFDGTFTICREHLEQAIMTIRAMAKKGSVFWYRTTKELAMGPVAYMHGSAYFVGTTDITEVMIPYNEDCAKPTSRTKKDDELLAELLNPTIWNGTRVRAIINSRILAKHPQVAFTIEEYLSGYPYSDLWSKKFPGPIDTDVRIYDQLPRKAGDVFEMFIQMLGGKSIPEDIKKCLNDRLG